MVKALLMSILVAPVAIPALAARERSTHLGLKKALFYTFVFEMVYLFFLVKIYMRTL